MVATIAIFALCLDALVLRSLSLLAPFIRISLHLAEGQLGYLMGAMMAGTALVVLPAGALIGRVDARGAFTLVFVSAGLALFLVSLQNSFPGLLAALFILGLMRAGIIPLVNRVITEQFDQARRGSIIGLVYAAVPLGGFMGAVALPALGEYRDWRAGFQILGLVALLGGFFSRQKLPEAGAGTLAENPLRQRGHLGSRAFVVLAITYGFYALSLSADAFVTLFLVDVVKISALAAGAFFGLIQLVGVGGRMGWGLLADRVFHKNRSWLLAMVNWLTVVSFILLIGLEPGSSWWMIGVVMAVTGMSVASSWGILSTVVGDMVELSSIAFATSIILFITNVADILGPILFGSALDSGYSYQSTLGMFAGIAVCTALILTWIAWRDRMSHNRRL